MSQNTVLITLPITRKSWDTIQHLSRDLTYKPTDLITDILQLGIGALCDTLLDELQPPASPSSQDLRLAVAKAVEQSRPGLRDSIPL